MGLIKSTVDTVRGVRNIGSFAPLAVSSMQSGRAQLPDASYATFAREGYMANELVFAAIKEIGTSAAEPALRYRRGKRWLTDDPPGSVLHLLNQPNKFLDRFQFFWNVLLHLSLAGNAYALIVRSGSGRPVELWLMRPDRIRIVPDSVKYIRAYEYDLGDGSAVPIPPEDVIHFKEPHPLNDYYGMPPLLPASGRVDIDNYMKDFVKTFFQKAGVPGGLLAIEQSLDDQQREEIKRRFKNDYGGAAGWHELIVLDSTKATFTPMTQNLGPSGLVVPELNMIDETRILMCFQVPPELIGALSGMQNSSYAQKDAARKNFWEETLAPIYKQLGGALTLRLAPNFAGVDEIGFDLTDVRALQEDVDKVHARWRSDLMAGICTIEEARAASGLEPVIRDGTFLIPANLTPYPAQQVAAGELQPAAPALPAPAEEVPA